MSNERWLSRIQGDPRLFDIVIPGSHDAGVYGDSLDTAYSPKSWARCQGSNIYNQAKAGSRMFDCRVFLRRKHGQLTPTMGHFFGPAEKVENRRGETGSLGAYGGTLVTCVMDALAFVKTYTTEFLILRFSHTYCPAEVIAAITQIRNAGNNAAYICTDGRALAKRRLADLRGKVIMVFADEFRADFDPNVGVLPFSKFAAGTATTSGLCTCGLYKGSSDIGVVHANAEQSFVAHAAHAGARPDHLHFVYWQQTLSGGNIKSKTTEAKDKTLIGREEKQWTGGAHANLGDFAFEIWQKYNAGTWRLPNVISHDFVTEQTCNPIIALNPGLLP
jgi:hypothetical protein